MRSIKDESFFLSVETSLTFTFKLFKVIRNVFHIFVDFAHRNEFLLLMATIKKV